MITIPQPMNNELSQLSGNTYAMLRFPGMFFNFSKENFSSHREPLPVAPQFIQPTEMIPISMPSGFLPEHMMQQQPTTRYETSSGVTFTYSKVRSPSRSPNRRQRGLGKERDKRRGSPPPRRGSRGAEQPPDDTFRQRTSRRNSRSKSRSLSPNRVDRVRTVKLFDLNSGSVRSSRRSQSQAELGKDRSPNGHHQKDLRECLNDRIQLAKAYAAEVC